MYSIYRLMQLIFSTSLKGIIRKECQSFTNHGHAKTPPAVFNPLSLWLTLPRDMGVSHTQWPLSITRAILACLWFAQGLHSREITEACCRPGHGPHRSHAETDLLGIMIIQPGHHGHQVVLCAGNRKDAGHPGRKKKCEACSFHLCYYQLEPVGSITSRQAYGAGMPAILIICRW